MILKIKKKTWLVNIRRSSELTLCWKLVNEGRESSISSAFPIQTVPLGKQNLGEGKACFHRNSPASKWRRNDRLSPHDRIRMGPLMN